ncbi:MAG: DMT family transporter [Gammaproteobacteria bacterium]|nr:DMT family transporter [Gammaproteobacteria bacterium]
MPPKYSPYLPLILLLLLGSIWGTGYSIARFAMINGVNPLGYSFWQSLGPAILITALVWIKRLPLPFSFAHCRYYLICGLTGIALPNTNMYFAAPHLPAGILAVVVNTVPLMAYLMALMAGLERFNVMRLASVAVALCGLMLLLIPKSSLPAPDMIPWVLTALLTPLCFAFCSVYITRFRPPNSNSFSLAAGTLIFSSALLAPLIVWTHSFYSFHIPVTLPDAVVLLEIVLSSIGYLLFFQLLKIAGPVYYSFVDTVVAITGLAWGYIIFAEKLNIWTGAAVTLILLSLLMISKQQLNKVK